LHGPNSGAIGAKQTCRERWQQIDLTKRKADISRIEILQRSRFAPPISPWLDAARRERC
jgi:hypothetical protein